MAEAIEVTATLPATPTEIYNAWLDGNQHAAFTGARATCEPRIGGAFTAHDGYIRGHIVDLFPATQIVQEWSTTDFPGDAQPSRLEIDLEANNDGTTLLRLRHSNLPDGQGASYEQGWHDNYFAPMAQYFEALRGGSPRPAEGEVGEPGVGRRSDEAAPVKKAAAATKKKAPAKKAPGKKKPAKKAASRTTAKKKTSAKKAAARTTNKKKAPAKKAAARTTAKKKTSAKKAAARTTKKKASAKKK